ncbi:Putative methylesterase 12, chloroplastic [Linum perenne]
MLILSSLSFIIAHNLQIFLPAPTSFPSLPLLLLTPLFSLFSIPFLSPNLSLSSLYSTPSFPTVFPRHAILSFEIGCLGFLFLQMGNFICKAKKDGIRTNNTGSRSSRRMGKSQRKLLAEEELLHRQALSMALHQHQLSQRFDGSMSRRIGSTSSRRKNLPDDVFATGKQSCKVLENLENIKIKKFVLVHGEGFGAWCWYKTIAQLEEVGLVPVALDLTGSGIDTTDTNCITTLAEYSKPLITYLENLPEDEKDIALAMVSMRVSPMGPMMEKLSLTKEKYGICRRFFVQTLDDRALSPDVQEKLVRENPPEGVFKIKGSDHCPFFSKPQSLHKILVEIAQIE